MLAELGYARSRPDLFGVPITSMEHSEGGPSAG